MTPSWVLIIDDDPLLGEMLVDILQQQGYEPLEENFSTAV